MPRFDIKKNLLSRKFYLLKAPYFVLLSLLFTGILIISTNPAYAGQLIQSGDWSAHQESEGSSSVCFMVSEPQKKQGKYKKRDMVTLAVTHRPASDSKNVVSIQAGYTYKKDSDVHVKIDAKSFVLFADKDYAFAEDDKSDNQLVKAMIAGSKLIVKGTSSRGTLTTDTYSLKGFTAAYRAIEKACK